MGALGDGLLAPLKVPLHSVLVSFARAALLSLAGLKLSI